MASSFFDLLAQNQPDVKTSQALLILGMQTDFLDAKGKLPAANRYELVESIRNLVPVFRREAGEVIWVQTEYSEDRAVNSSSGEGDMVLVDFGADDSSDGEADELKALPRVPSKAKSSSSGRRALDLLKRVSARKRPVRAPSPLMAAVPPPEDEEEFFLTRSAKKGAACLPSSPGAEMGSKMIDQLDEKDLRIITTYYSAFNSTKLLIMLRAKLITELYICGCLTNISVYATALDAARHGFTIYLVEDCLGYRKLSRHEDALRQMHELMGIQILTSSEIIKELCKPDDKTEACEKRIPISAAKAKGTDDAELLHQLVSNLRINEKSASKSAEANPSKDIARSLSDTNGRVSRPPRTVVIDELEAEDDAQMDRFSAPSEDLEVRSIRSLASTTSRRGRDSVTPDGLVKSKIRMRNRSKREPKSREEKSEESKRASNSTSSSKPPENSKEGSRSDPVTQESSKDAASTASPRKETEVKCEGSKSPTKSERAVKLAKSQPLLSSLAPRVKSITSSSANRPHSLGASVSKSPSSPNLSDNNDKTLRPSSLSAMGKKAQNLSSFPTLGPKDAIGEGDSKIIHDFFPESLCHKRRSTRPVKDEIFHWLYREVQWQTMHHAQGEVPRLVCCQGQFGKDGSMPVYRHPSDQSLPLLHFSPTVQLVREQVEKIVKHPVNHVLIQLYRSGADYISEHSDKSLDIVRGSNIANVSFGAQRTMRLRTKRSEKDTNGKTDELSKDLQRSTQRVHMPHNSMFILGQETNMRWLHGINADKRLDQERSEAERAYGGMRISLTFRHIGTFLDNESTLIWGQGATAKDRANANEVFNDDEEQTDRIIRAFGKENQSTEFDWDRYYGVGFDVLHFRKPPADSALFFANNEEIETRQVSLCLAELSIPYTTVQAIPPEKGREHPGRLITFRDVDANHSEVQDALPILLYLDRYYQLDRSESGKATAARAHTILLQFVQIGRGWCSRYCTKKNVETIFDLVHEMEEAQALHGGEFIAGDRFSIADCAAWPVLDAIVEGWEGWTRECFPKLTAYYERLYEKRRTVRKLRKGLAEIQ